LTAQKDAMNGKITAFNASVENSDDLADQLPSLAQHLAEFTGSTACYIGKLTKPIKGVSKGMPEDASDQAHIIDGAKEEIQFIHASQGFEFMEGKVLTREQGITFDMFKPEEKPPPAKHSRKESRPATPQPAIDPNALPEHILVPEVVREQRMHYF
jgi:hypothetical protein